MVGERFLILKKRESFTEFTFIPEFSDKKMGKDSIPKPNENSFRMRFDSVEATDWLGNKVEK